jgi:hypothetical protein
MVSDLQSLRLSFKRAFTDYFLALRSPGITDPTEPFASCYDYLSVLRAQLGGKEFMYRLDDETINLAGQVEQDLRHRSRRGGGAGLLIDAAASDDLEDRMRECFEYALGRLNDQDRSADGTAEDE